MSRSGTWHREREPWQVSGSAPEVYEREIVPALFGPWAKMVVDLASLKSGERVLDLACGTGVVARLAAQHVGPSGKVVGLDLNPGMITVARSLPPVPGPNIEWREGDASNIPMADSLFNVVICQLGIQFFTDRAKALRSIYRVLVENGRLILLVWRGIQYSPGFAALADALKRNIGPDPARVMQAPFSLGDARELRSLLIEAGFDNIVIDIGIGSARFASAESMVSAYVAASPLNPHVTKASEHARMSLIREVTDAMEHYTSDKGLVFPIEGNLAVATKR
jgi:SAM-dependent methyltransferase